MNNCKIGNGKVVNDNRNQTMTNFVKDAVEKSSIEFKSKGIITLISEINDNTESFINFFNEELKERGIDLVVNSIEDINSKINNSKNANYNNLTVSILVSYLKHIVSDVSNYDSIGILSNYGFTSRSARELGAEYIADILFEEIHNNERLPKKQRMKHKDLINKVRNRIRKEWDIKANNFIVRMDNEIKAEEKANTESNIKSNRYGKYKTQKVIYDTLVKNTNEQQQIFNEAREALIQAKSNFENNKNAETKKLLDEKQVILDKENKKLDDLKKAKKEKLMYIINMFGNTKEKNFTAIYENLNYPQFVDRIWSQRKISDYRNTYEDGFNNDFIEENDIVTIEAESIDETSKTWSENTSANYTNGISKDVKYHLSTIHKMSTPVITIDKVEKYKNNYDTDNSCGVPTTYPYKYVVNQLESKCDFGDIFTFMDSLRELATTNPNNYGFIELYSKLEANMNVAVRLFNQLKKPAVDKTIINNSKEKSDKNYISNEQKNAKTSQYYQMINSLKSNYSSREEYKEDQTKALNNINSIISEANKRADDLNNEDIFITGKKGTRVAELTEEEKNQINNILSDLFVFYFPHLHQNVITKVLESIDNKDIIQKYKDIVDNFNNIFKYIDYQIKIELQEYDKHRKAYGEWIGKQNNGGTSDPKPVYTRNTNFDITLSNEGSKALIEFAELIYKFDKNNVELNSKNAEGNLSSDLQKNCYITRILDILKSDNIQALINLKTEIDACPQYRYNPLFYGLRDEQGKLLVHGLFNTETNDIDMEGVKLINITLFDGIINDKTNEGITYSQLTKNDYFITKLIKYFYPSVDKSSKSLEGKACESFFNTPSDAPKNYTIRLPRFKFHDKKGVNMVTSDNVENTRIIDDTLTQMINNIIIENHEDDARKDIINIKQHKTELYYLSDEEFTELITNNGKVNIRFNETLNKDYKDDIVYKVLYKSEDKTHILYVKDGNYNNNKEKKNRHFQINNATIVDIVSFDSKGGVISKENSIKSFIKTITSKDKKIGRNIIEKNIMSGNIKFNVNRNTEMFIAYKQNVKSEINGFVNALNAIFVRDKDGYYRIKSDKTAIANLLEKYHYNGEIVKDGKLTGNVFKFNKLFDTSIYDANAAIETMLSLYGGDGIIKTDGRGLYINPDNIVGEDSKVFISIDENGKFILNNNFNLNAIIDEVVDNWIKAFSVDIISNYQQYVPIIDEVLKHGDNTMYKVMEMIYGDILNNYFITELFSGEPSFYKDSRDYLKRAKEVQAGGETFAFYGQEDMQSKEIGDIEFKDYKIDFVDTKGNPVEIKPKNGFKAVTIKNTVNVINNNEEIYNEIYKHNVKQLTEAAEKKRIENKQKGISENKDVYTKDEIEVIAKSRAKQVAERFGYGKDGRNTKKNDAQSYITFEEFIRRRLADGTIDEYKDIINSIIKIRKTKDITEKQKLIDDFTLKSDVKVQVQKNFYFDMHFDSETGVRYPRQVKNAEFVLIPEFLEGTTLLDLYNVMIENGIDQINTEETNKAAKRNILTFWDNNGVADKNNFVEQLKANPKAIDNYYYKYLYKQQDIVDHMVDEKNKAGVQIFRKLVDNATENTKPFVDKYIDNYIANIEESYAELLYSCGWKINEKGNIVNQDGSDISFEEFFKKGKAQAAKLGLDSNFAEYFEIDSVTKLPKIPVWMNSVSGKIESISQAIFNSVITRQQLPGWHAAQVTGIGIGKQIADEKGVYHELKYHEAVTDDKGNVVNQPYIEIMLPRWSKLLEGKSIEDIQNGNCDIQLIYRMPTEGKQSVAIAKVVGILPDVYGSTVLVPDAWVTQTGSDFDVDTVYAITYNMYTDKNGELKKVEFDNDISDKAVKRRYINYVSRLAKLKLEKGFYDGEQQLLELNKLNEDIERIKQSLFKDDKLQKELFDNYNNTKKNIFSLSGNKNVKLEINRLIEQANKNQKDRNSTSRLEYYKDILNGLNNAISNINDNFSETDIDQFIMLKNTLFELVDYLENINDKHEELHKSIIDYKNIKEESLDNTVKALNNIAINNGIVTFKEFSKWDIVKQNSKKARENVILDNMIAIMEHPDSREENFYCSNFDDITNANKKVQEYKTANSHGNSVYNPFMQVQYLEDAMGGAAIKAFSVTRDNGVSLFNRLHATLSDHVTVKYHKNEIYDKKTISGAYDIINNDENIFIVQHNKLGWSKNNRNVVGKLCTAYGSQTTAHSLDTIKEGAIYNENLYTFGTFKTLIDLGIDYRTAINWLALPGIENIVKHYYKTNSVYISDNANPIKEAIKELAFQYLNIDIYTPYGEILQSLKNLCANEAAELGYDINNLNSILTLDTKLIEDRLSGKMDGKYELAMDLLTILQFEKLHGITGRIEDLLRCTNPDKFGAKQSIHETYEIVDKINKYRKNGSSLESDIKTSQTILVDGKELMDVLYPINKETGEIDVKESPYQYIAAFYKYSTLTSVLINKNLFVADNILMMNERYNYRNQRTFFGRKLNNEEYKQLREYLVHYIYGLDELLTSPISISVENIKGKRNTKGNIELKQNESKYYWEDEYARIKGVETTLHEVKIKDFDNPTQEEVDDFAKLTPVKKLKLLKRHFGKEIGIFDKIGLNLFSGNNTKDRIKTGNYTQTLSINIQNEDIEELYKEFNNTISSKNPLIKLTAIDLIKYAFMVEGFRFTRNGITNVITNNAISNNRDGFAINGINNEGDLTLVESLYNIMNRLENQVNNKDFNTITEIFDRFVRSNSDIIKNDRFLLSLKGDNKFDKTGAIPDKYTLGYNCFYFRDNTIYGRKVINRLIDRYNLNKSSNDTNNDFAVLPRYFNLTYLVKKDIASEQDKMNNIHKYEYIETTNLFRVLQTNNGIVLVGVPKLDKGEVYRGSLNQENNRDSKTGKSFINPELIDAVFDEIMIAESEDKFMNDKGEYIKYNIKLNGHENITFKKQVFKADTTYDKENMLLQYLDASESKKGGANHLISVVNDYITNSPVEGMKQEFSFLTLNPNMQNLVTSDDIKNKNNIFKIPNTDVYIKVNKSVITTTFLKAVEGNQDLVDKLGYSYKDAIRVGRQQISKMRDNNARKHDARMYKVEILSKEEVDNYRNGNVEMRSATPLLGFSEGETARRISVTSRRNMTGEDQVAMTLGSVIKDIIFHPSNKNDVFLSKLKNFIQYNGIRLNEERDITKHRKQLNDLLKDYYLIKGKEYLHKFTNYFNTEDEISIDSEAIQDLIGDNQQSFYEFVKFLLDARNFGREFDKFIKFVNEDGSTDNTFDEVVNIIKAVSENDKLSKAIKNVFNEYLATRFSTNPLVQNRLIDITMSFEDVSITDKWFSDVAELNNKEVQLVVKYVEAILDASTQLDAPVIQKKFSKEYDELIEAGAKIERIIDYSTGKLMQDFTDEFLKEKERYSDMYHKAKDTMDVARHEYNEGNITSDEYENTIINFYRTKLDRNIWISNNIHQAYVDSYYKDVNHNEISILFNNGLYKNDIAKQFAKYVRLTEELNNIKGDKVTFTDEEIVQIKTLNKAIRELLNPSILDNITIGALTPEQLKAKEVSDTLNQYLKNKTDINKKYFEYVVSEEWKATKNMYEQYIKNYDNLHPDYNIKDKLNDSRYKEAYNWLLVNSKKQLTTEGQIKLNKALTAAKGDPEKRKDIEDIFIRDKAFDEYGNRDPRKLSKESIEKIKEITQQTNYSVNVDTENRVIKESLPNQEIIITNRAFRDLLEPFNNENHKKKGQLVKEINKILIKGVEKNTGKISTELLWKNTTIDERKKLADLFDKLNKFKSGVSKVDFSKFNNKVNFKTNTVAFDRNKNEAALLHLSEEEMNLWNSIFMLEDRDLKKPVPNRFMFGYVEIKDEYRDKYIDKEKTDAISFLSRNTNRRPTVYYYLSRDEAIANNNYEQWFEENHYYNTYTGKVEPLTIWTESEVIPGQEVHAGDDFEYYLDYEDLSKEETIYEYEPTFDNKYRQIREEYINKPNGKEYNKYDYNYRTDTGYYNNESAYNDLSDSEKQATEQLRQLLLRYAKEYAFTNSAKSFVNKGFLPRQYVPVHNAAYYAKEVGKFIGVDVGNGQAKEYHSLDYDKDMLPSQSMYDIIKTKGYKEERSLPKKPKDVTEEELRNYYEEVEKIKKENEEIRKNNIELENSVRNNDWKAVFNQLISIGEEYKSRQKAKDVIYLLLEDLKSKNPSDSSKAFVKNKLTGKLIKNDKNVSNPLSFEQVEQDNLYHVVSTWARRVIYSEYKKPHIMNNAARIVQNIVSSKYMMLNLPGGIANVATGFNNIFGEMFAGTYFDTKNVSTGWWRWNQGWLDYIGSFVANTEPKTKEAAMIKLFNVVDYDRMLGRAEGESLAQFTERLRDSLFVFQSGGEHFMQNIALHSLFDSHRVYQYTRRDGKTDWKVGTFNNYIWDIEQQAMRLVLKEIEQEINEPDSLISSYENFINFISKDIEALNDFDALKKDFNREFIKKMYEGDTSELAKRYRAKVKELTQNAKEHFESNFNTFYDEFDFDGETLRLKADSVFRDTTKSISDDPFDIGFADKYKENVFGAFRNKAKKVNNKIHGVYDKLGAASIETTNWLGSLIMQYHKHIYPGIMKRWRGLFNRAYYNEMRESQEKGSYTSLIQFLGIEFDGLIKRTKEDVELNNTLKTLAFLKQTTISIINTFKNFNENRDTIPDWERQNMRRIWGDLVGCALAFGTAILMFAGTDDDELEDNNVYATVLYLTDRIYSEARMYTPWGLVGEAKTMWSSPVAFGNTFTDILKLTDLGIQWMFDEDFNVNYTTGLYKGRNKFAVVAGRNVPIYRIYNRLANMNKNTKYYRIGNKGIHKKAKTIADYING